MDLSKVRNFGESMSSTRWFILWGLTLLIGAYQQDIHAKDFHPDTIRLAYDDLTFKEKTEFHHTLMKVLEIQTKSTKYSDPKINVLLEKISQHNFSGPDSFIDLFLPSTFANDPTLYCHFGGWMATMDNDENCMLPWSRWVRGDAEMETFGATYEHSCGGANLFRCNPLIFGPGEDGKGICTTTDDSDPNLSTSSCLEDFMQTPDALENKVNELQEDPQALAQYLAITAETMRLCEVRARKFSYCNDLLHLLESTSKAAVTCEAHDSLVSLLPNIVTPFNEDELNEITHGLGAEAIRYARELEERQERISRENREVLEEALAGAAQESTMAATIERIRNNASKCLRGLCKGTEYSSSKPATKSIAKCAAYVKHAIYPYPSESGERYANFSEYPWGRDADDAVEGGNWLKDHGFENILDYPEMSHLTPETAPPGAIIVYEKINSRRNSTVDGVRRGAPGHIEIKASANEYISDFINDEPTRIGGLRRPIAIYYQIPDSYKERLQEVPQ
ncbi:MAG: hypothetical protein CME63_07250 [Halobacteriovoraceae bacterium]|nr:hypothetical protein [Halobacteriovoraceae bacterium]